MPLSVCAQLPSFLHAAVKEAQPSVFTPEVDAAWLQVRPHHLQVAPRLARSVIDGRTPAARAPPGFTCTAPAPQVAGDAAPLLVRAVARARPTVKPPALAECVALCKASWAALDDISEAGVQTYLHMFTADPKTLKLFIFQARSRAVSTPPAPTQLPTRAPSPPQNVPLASMEADGRLRRHVRKTFGVVGRLLTAIPDGTADLSGFRRDVERIGASHGHKLVSAGMLDSFGAGLLNALPPLLLDKWTPETAAAWAALYAETKHAFVGGLNAWRAGAYPDAAITGCAPPEFRVPGDYAVGGGAARAAPLHGTRAGVP